MDPIDPHLMRLAAMPTPGGLDALESGVFAAIEDGARARAATRTLGAWTIAAALTLGLAGGGILGGSATPAQAASPIGIDGALAPSTLLLGRS